MTNRFTSMIVIGGLAGVKGRKRFLPLLGGLESCCSWAAWDGGVGSDFYPSGGLKSGCMTYVGWMW